MLDMATIKITDAPPPDAALLDDKGNSTLPAPRVFTEKLAASMQEGLREKFGDGVTVTAHPASPPELPQDRAPNDTGGVSGQRLKSFIERIERITSEQKELGDDKKEIFAEAKATGFCTKTMRKIIRLRGMDAEKRREEEQMEELYLAAIGMQTEMDV